jgi:hypothetical protein
MYGQQQEISISLFKTHPLQLAIKEMPTNVDFCCLSHSYSFGVKNISAKAWHNNLFRCA